MSNFVKTFYKPLTDKQRAEFIKRVARDEIAGRVYMGSWVEETFCGTTACLGGHALAYLTSLRPVTARKIALPSVHNRGTTRLETFTEKDWFDLARGLYEQDKRENAAIVFNTTGKNIAAFQATAKALGRTDDEQRQIHSLFLETNEEGAAIIKSLALIWLSHASQESTPFYRDLVEEVGNILG